MTETNYADISIPSQKAESEYTWAQRRAALYEDLKNAGHYRNLPYTHREYGNRFDVSHTTIKDDIQTLLDYEAERLGEQADTELELVKGKAVKDWLTAAQQHRQDDEYDEAAKCMSNAYNLISKHYRTLMDVGIIDDTADVEWNVSSEVVEVVEPEPQ